jgi:bifunctional non-homologous end joining protein LigD
MAQTNGATYIEIEGKTLRLTHLDKVMFPEDGFTKAELLLYYQTVAPVLLPHIRGRPLTLKAFPNGVKERPYYRRRLASTAPNWVNRIELEDGFAPVIADSADLLWVVNLDSVELHPWLSRRDQLSIPDQLVFDLDPGSRVPFQQVCEAATVVKEALDTMGVECWAKTSGSRGIHILVGMRPEFEFEEVHTWAIAIARVLTDRRPDLFSMDYTRNRRTDKTLLDHNQIGYGRTTASIYSVRPLSGAPVSAPVTWEEVNSGKLSIEEFTIKTLPDRIERLGDVARALLNSDQRLPHL